MKCAKCGATLFKADIVRGNCFTCGCTIISKKQYEVSLENKKILDENYKKYFRYGNFVLLIGLGEARMFKKQNDVSIFFGIDYGTIAWRIRNNKPIGGYRVFNSTSIDSALDWEKELAYDMLKEMDDNIEFEIVRELDLDPAENREYFEGFKFVYDSKWNNRGKYE